MYAMLFGQNSPDRQSIQQLISKNIISEQEAIELDPFERLNLESAAIQTFIEKKIMSKDSAKKLLTHERLNLESSLVQELLKRKVINLEKALALTGLQRINLEDPRVQRLLDSFEENIRLQTKNYLDVNSGCLLSPAQDNDQKATVIFNSMKEELTTMMWQGLKDLGIYGSENDPMFLSYIDTAKDFIISDFGVRQKK